MSHTQGLVFDSGYHASVAPPQPVVERTFPIWTVVFVVLATVAAFAPSLAVTLVADLREPSPSVCVGDGVAGRADGVAAAAATRRATTEAVVAGHAPGEGRC